MDDALVTPEAVVLDLPVASVPTRLLAAVLDVVLQVTLLLLALLAGSTVLGTFGGASEVVGVVAASLLVFATQLVYPTVLEWRLGGTLGQLAFGLRVVTTDGGRPTLRQTATRTAVGILELEGTFGFLALLTATVHPRGRRLGDLAAGTLVVRSRAGEAVEVLAPTIPAHLRGWAAALDTSTFGQQERAALRRYLTRRTQVPAATRGELAADLAGRLVPRAGAVPPPGAQPDDLVVALAAVAGRSPGLGTPSARSSAPPGPASDASPVHGGPTSPTVGAPVPPSPAPPGTTSSTGFVPPA